MKPALLQNSPETPCLECGTYTQGGSYTDNDNTDSYTQSDHYDPDKRIFEQPPERIEFNALKELIQQKYGTIPQSR